MKLDKQPVLKPQDLFVVMKIAVNRGRTFILQQLAEELQMPLSSVHGSIRRGENARLLSRSAGSVRVIRSSVSEFLIHGAKYAFPGQLGASTRGMPTSIGAPVLAVHFEGVDVLSPVWPDPVGTMYGQSLLPIHPSAPSAARTDLPLYEALALLDALRVGAARERELATQELQDRLA
jgi:hypothetical protein